MPTGYISIFCLFISVGYYSIMEKPKSLTFSQKLAKITDLSVIRLQKLLEIAQYTMIYFIIGLFCGYLIEKMFPKDTAQTAKNRYTVTLFILSILQVTIDTITIFYISKIVILVPFLFQLTPDYHPSLKGEAQFGEAVALSLTFIGIQPSLGNRINELARRWGLVPED